MREIPLAAAGGADPLDSTPQAVRLVKLGQEG